MPKAINRDQFAYIPQEAWRVLTAVEMGMKNHDIVPLDLLQKISNCKSSGSKVMSILKDILVPQSLVAYEVNQRNSYRGYRLTNFGYDYLALNAMVKSEQISDIGAMIGSGKESDVYLAVAGTSVPTECFDHLHDEDDDRPFIVVKFHRLGRVSFRKVKEKREYHNHRANCSWLYLDRLAAKREYDVMEVLHNSGLPVPMPVANNRNAVVMQYFDKAVPLCQVSGYFLKSVNGYLSKKLYEEGCKILLNCVQLGLIHGDFNEFNLLVTNLPNDKEESCLEESDFDKTSMILIDFPQMLSREHRDAQEIYMRDLEGFMSFFAKFIDVNEFAGLEEELEDIERTDYLDVAIKAPGFPKLSKLKQKEILKNLESASDCESNDSNDKAETDNVDENEEQVDELCKKVNRIKLKHDKSALLTKEEIRTRQRREQRREERAQFNSSAKKQARVGRKNKFRENLKAEIDLFGI